MAQTSRSVFTNLLSSGRLHTKLLVTSRCLSASLVLARKLNRSLFRDVEIPETGSFTDHVFKDIQLYGERTAFVDAVTGQSHSFRSFYTSIKQLGANLVDMGLRKGDVFSAFCPNSMEYLLVYHGVISVGGVFTAVNPLCKPRELLYQLRESRARFLLTTPSLAETAKQAAAEAEVETVFVLGEAGGCVPFHPLFEGTSARFQEIDIDIKNDLAVLPYSSGTTGLPKAVMLTHQNLVSNLYQTRIPELNYLSTEDTVIAFVPMFHIYGLFYIAGLYPSLGVKTVLLNRFTLEDFLQAIQDYKSTVIPVVPPVAVMMAKSPLVKSYDLSSLRMMSCGAAPLSLETIQALKDRFPHMRLKQKYGLTEASPITHSLDEDNLHRHGSVGGSVPNTEWQIVDTQDGRPLSANERGEVWVRGPQVMKGYLNKPQATAETLDNEGWLRTGDIGYFDNDGYLFIVDRVKEIIMYKAYQVAPAELEAILLGHPRIEDAAVIGIKDDLAGELPKAFVVRKGELTEADVQDFVQKNVAPHKKLRGGVKFVEKIPKSPSGKILRRILRETKTSTD